MYVCTPCVRDVRTVNSTSLPLVFIIVYTSCSGTAVSVLLHQINILFAPQSTNILPTRWCGRLNVCVFFSPFREPKSKRAAHEKQRN